MSGVAVGAAVVGSALYMGNQQEKAQKSAQQQAQQQAEQQAEQARVDSEKLTAEYQKQTEAYQQQAKAMQQQLLASQQSFNQANQKQPNAQRALSAVGAASRAGQSGTMLTGSQGVDTSALALGKNTLLGQ